MHIQILFLLVILSVSIPSSSQVIVGSLNSEEGALLQLDSPDKGLLIPKIALLSRQDETTILPSAVEGLLVYNTSNTGSNINDVSEGFYYWDGLEWKRMYATGFTNHFQQTTPVTSTNTNTIYTITNLDQTINLPYAGTYQVFVTAYYALGDRDGGQDKDGSGYSEIFLEVDGNKVANAFVVCSSKKTQTATFNKLAQQTKIVKNINLSAGDHTFTVKAQEWANRNTASGDGYFGRNTAAFAGNIGKDGANGTADDDNDAQKATMTITLLRQF